MRFSTYTSSCLFAVLSLLNCFGQAPRQNPRYSLEQFASLPLPFEQNVGQNDPSIRFVSESPGYEVCFERGQIVMVLHGAKGQTKSDLVKISILGADSTIEPRGIGLLPGVTNYYVGSNSAQWRANVKQFRQVRYHDVYPGVDLVFYGNRRQMEFDLDVKPGADVSAIGLKFDGATITRTKGNLELTTSLGQSLILKKPELYQGQGHSHREVRGGYVIRKDNEVAFAVGPYNRREELVIDPALVYSTLAQIGNPKRPLVDVPFAIATDSSGAAYVTGQTFINNNFAAFVAKFDPSGSNLVYQTFLGGSQPVSASPLSTVAAGFGIAVDANGSAYVTGMTLERDFPTTNGSYSTAPCDQGLFCLEGFAAKLTPSGNLAYSTFLVQHNTVDTAYPVASSLALDSSGALYITGTTAQAINDLTGLPLPVAGLATTPGAFQPARGNDATGFVLKLHPDGSKVDYLTYLGGNKSETTGGIAVDSTGVAYVAGGTFSADFPTTMGASLTTNPGTASFFTKLKADGSGLLYSTFVAGPNGQSEATSIAIDASTSAYLTGMSAANFPVPSFGNASLPAFAAKFDASGNLVYSKLLGTQMTYGLDLFIGTPPQSFIASDSTGAAFIANGSGGFETSTLTVNKLDSAGSLVYTQTVGPIDPHNSRFSGAALDSDQNFYIAGTAGSLPDSADPLHAGLPDIVTTVGAFQTSPIDLNNVQEIMFVQKIAQSLGSAVAAPNPRIVNFTPILQKGVTSNPRTIMLFNDGDADLALSSIGLGGANPADFAISSNNCGATVVSGTNCTFLVTFTPTVNQGTRNATVNFTFGGGLAPQAVSLSGQSGIPGFQADPSPVSFGDVALGNNSNILLSLTITNTGTAPFNLLAQPVVQGTNSSDFFVCVLLTGHCSSTFPWPSSLPAGQKITVPLAFKPSGIGVRTAQFVFQTDAPGGPQMVQLTGNGTALALAAPAGSSATVAAGQTATYNLVVTTGTTVSGTITMSCSGAPSGASCSPNPGSFSLGTVASQNVMVTVSTTPRSSASLLPLHPGLWWGLAGTLGIAFLRPRNRRPRRLLMMAGSLALLGTMLSCGGGGSGSGGGGNSGTPAGTYTLSVSASGNSASNNLPLKLTVQ